MREIKFRSWNKQTKCYFKWDISIAFTGTGKLWCDIEQYTGLKDKNGKEIYEGDIVVHGGFYWQEGSSEDYFGTEPQNSWNVVEAFPEHIKSFVDFKDGSFVLKQIRKNKKGENNIIRTLFDFINEKWNMVEELALLHPNEHDNNMSEGEFKTIADMKKYLSHIEIIGNIHESK